MKIKIGILGCAEIAKRSIIPAILNLKDKFELICVASRTIEKAKEYANLFSCKPIIGYENILNEDIDAIYLALPTGLHDEWINKALKAGKHVYAEKSIANSLESATKMVIEAKKQKVGLMEGYMFQYHTQHIVVKNLLNYGEIGDIRCFRSSFGFPPLDNKNFRYNNEIGGGVLFDAAGYPLRATHFILGNDFKVSSSSLFYDSTLKTDIYGSAFLKNRNGISAQIAFGFDNFYQCNYEIWGSKGKITALRAFTPAKDFMPTLLLEKPNMATQTILAEPCNHFEMSLIEFFNITQDDILKAKHYNDILIQSENLDLIKQFSK